jgi:hypothetical protein
MQGQVPEHQGLQTRDSAVCVLHCSTVLAVFHIASSTMAKVISHQPVTMVA